MEESTGDSHAETLDCPHCGQPVDVSAVDPAAGILCPHCQGEFVLPGEADEQAEKEAAATDSEEELSNLRIRQISTLRRGAYRSRSYCIIATVALIVAAIKLISMTVRHVHRLGWQARPIGYLFGVVAALLGAQYFGARTLELTRELAKPLQDDPPQPPDLSTLSDGSQHAKHLEEM